MIGCLAIPREYGTSRGMGGKGWLGDDRMSRPSHGELGTARGRKGLMDALTRRIFVQTSLAVAGTPASGSRKGQHDLLYSRCR